MASRRTCAFLLVCLVCVALAATAWAQGGRRTTARDRQAAVATGTGTLSGRVTSTEGAPVRRAQIQLIRTQGGPPTFAMTDAEGRYSFTQLAPGSYTIRANKAGYVNFAFGQRGMNDAVPPVILGEGESLTGLNIVLPRGSAIAGRVTDEFGDPVLQAQVQAMRYQYLADGQKRLVPGGPQAITDDLGQFRLYGLTPGEYVVSASTTNRMGPGPGRFQQDEPDEGYAPTFYPGTPNPAEAQAISVGLGQELTVPIQLVLSRLSRVAGVVVDSQGRTAPQGTPVMLRPTANLGGVNVRSANTTEEGAFTLTGAPPGEYVLEVRPRQGQRPPGDPGPALDGEFAVVPLSLGGSDVTGMRIVTGKGSTLSGRVVFEGTPPPAGSRVRVVPQSADPSRNVQMLTRSGPNDGVIGADGSFQLDGIAAPTFLRITFESGRGGGPPPEPLRYMTKSVLVDGVDVADVPFDPTRRGSVSGITVIVTDKLTEISGSVNDTRGGAVQATVLLVPEALPAGVSPTRFVRILQADANGLFSVRGMPAGRYAAVAISTFDQMRQYDPEVIQRARQVGRSFSVREGESVTLDLRLTTDF